MFTFDCGTGSLTTGVDEFTGSAGDDTYTGVIDVTANATVTSLDNLDGGAGSDVFNLNILQNAAGNATTTANDVTLPSIQLANIETMNVRAAVATDLDVEAFDDITNVNVTQATGDLTVTAAATTNVTTSGSKETVTVEGGKDVSITDATADKDITASAGATKNAAGTITVTDTDQGTGNIVVDGGTDVTITATTEYSELSAGIDHVTDNTQEITVGANKAATGDVVVTKNTTLTDATDTVTTGAMAVTGGATITVNNNITNTATKDSGGVNNITSGDIAITADDATTAVTVTQTVVANDYAAVTTGATYETAVITFFDLVAGEEVFVSEGAADGAVDLSFVATEDMTAAEVAAAFANLTNADKQSAGGTVSKGYFQGTLDAGWTSGAADGDKVTFTATTIGPKTDLVLGSDATGTDTDSDDDATNQADADVSVTDGSNGTSTTARDITADYGDVDIDDTADKSITDVTVDGYATLNIGTTAAANSLDNLVNLSLANSAGTATVDTAAGITSLNLTVNNVKHDVDLATNSTTITTLNLTGTTKASTFELDAHDTTDLNVDGDQLITLTGSTLTDLEKVVVTGTAGLTIGGTNEADTLTSVDTTGTTGTTRIAIDGTAATYTGGAGNDIVTLATGTALTKAINLGSGTNTLIFDADVAGSTALLSGGTGSADTLSMTAARAAALDGAPQTFYTNFERLTINDGGAGETIILDNLGFTDYVTTTGNASATFADAATDVAHTDTDETFTFVYNGIEYTTAAINGTNAAAVDTAIDAAQDADGNVLGIDKVTATFTNTAADLTITVDNAGDSLVGGTYNSGATQTGVAATVAATNTTLTLQKMDSNGTLVLAGTGAVTVEVTDADEVANDSDILNIIANVSTTDYNYGLVTVADVETVNISATDTNVDEDDDGTEYETGDRDETTLTLTADEAETVNVTGNADVDLTLTGTTKLELLDASDMTGALTVTTAGTTAVTVQGGEAGDTITAATGVVDTLYGNAGDDILTSGTKTIMYGGEGNDTFNISFVASQTVNDYAVIKDLASGDTIKMFEIGGAGMAAFAKLTDANTPAAEGSPNLSDYANAAALQNTTDNGAVWFTFGENTFIFIEGDDSSDTPDYNSAEDNLVMITGTAIDLDTGASFNATSGTLEIA